MYRVICPSCKRTILDSDLVKPMGATQLLVVVDKCRRNQNLEWTDAAHYYNNCVYCDPKVRNVFLNDHTEEETPDGRIYYLIKAAKPE